MKISEIRQIPAAELSQRIADEVANYNQLVLNHSISPLENPSQIKAARRTIAQMKTVLREIELNK
uniref:50S ribosomal protein L29 n=1 Tax=Alloprevotella sp. TaxID=1872471 RepID=UPI003FEE9347